METRNSFYNISQTANYLNISTVSVRNWITHGILLPVRIKNKIYFSKNQVHKLKQNLENGKINRLSSRANKQKANKIFIPEEYLKDKTNLFKIKTIVNYILKNNLDIFTSLFMLSIKFGINENLIEYNNQSFNIKDIIFINQQFKTELLNWYESIKVTLSNNLYFDLLNFNLPLETDILGIIYQSLMIEGEKSKKGSYYTPQFIVNGIINDYLSTEQKILDPCCGTGQFLIAASKKIKNPHNIYGIDIDKIAVKIARINLISAYKNINFQPNIYNNNFLLDFNIEKYGKFDLIITNPPWGGYLNKTDLKLLNTIYPQIKSKESFSYILNRSLSLLNEDGVLSFILPESILNVKIHNDIRNILLTQSKIKKIIYLGRIFTNVFTPVIRIDLIKSQKNMDNHIRICNGNNIFSINQNVYRKNKDYIFNINTNNFDYNIIKKIFSFEHFTLKNRADWALGIVTGNNERYITTENKPKYEPIITGREVKKYQLQRPLKYINFTPDKFQQVAAEEKYRAKEKLIYKFISKYLIFSFDNTQVLTLNSANILIPKIKDYNIKIVLALFNSNLYQFLYQKLFSSIKILRSHLETLPLPVFSKNQKQIILELVNDIINNNIKIYEFDNFLYTFFEFSDKEKNYIDTTVNKS